MHSIVADAGSGELWEMEPGRPARFRILSSATDGQVAVFEERVPLGSGTPLHMHHTSEELIHVHSGTFRFHTGGSSRDVGAGGWVFIPRGTTHGWRNVGTADGDLSFVFTPAAGAVCFEELRKHERLITEIPEADLIATFTRHGYEMVTFDWD